MNEQMFSSLGDPINTKIIMEIQKKGQATATQLMIKYDEIPQATLYRHLKKMLSDGILKVIEENSIRGTVEKVYALGFDIEEDIKKGLEANDGGLYLQLATQYMLGVLREFQEYTDKDNINIVKDGSGFSVTPVYATVEELTEALLKINKIISRLETNSPDGKRQLHSLCLITTPPKDL